jgi:ABC-type multidrug transport system fused ATPase/permease subunit
MGATPSTLTRMALNILFENLIDMIPVLGSLFDFWWQSNNRNMQILEQHLENPEKASVTSRVVVLLVIFAVFVVLFLFLYLSWMMLQVFIGLLS